MREEKQITFTKEWTCTCGRENHLRDRKCTECGTLMPEQVKEKIFTEELSYQKREGRREYKEQLPARIRKYQKRNLRRALFMTLFLFLTAVGAYAADGFLHTDGSFSSAVNRKTTFAEQRKESFLSGKGQEISKHVKERLFEGTQIENLTDNAKKRLFEETQVEDLTDNAKLRFRQIMETAENFVRRVKGIANH